MIPTPVQKPYLFGGRGYDSIEEMEAARDKHKGIEPSALLKMLEKLSK